MELLHRVHVGARIFVGGAEGGVVRCSLGGESGEARMHGFELAAHGSGLGIHALLESFREHP